MSHFSEATKDFGEIKKRMAEAIKEATAPARAALVADFRAVFEKHPDVKHILWRQYTPYFNDGEPCVFRVRDVYVFTGADGEDDYEGDWKHPANKDLPDVGGNGTEDLLLAMFGDHVKVTLKRDAADFEVDEYDHD